MGKVCTTFRSWVLAEAGSQEHLHPRADILSASVGFKAYPEGQWEREEKGIAAWGLVGKHCE
jgi:hypothetical protein